ncbi:hypothetical protein ABT093_37790 [Kitasatospora sp. NPDC002551]|uniref:hypothetical protein n=1 Tax=Kitasatospora sp. NPDC002551 TaxID=3154539 RepID=UPI0033212153
MELKVLAPGRHWMARTKERRKLAEITSPLGMIDVIRGPMSASAHPREFLERWEFVLDGADLLLVDDMGVPGYGARKRVAAESTVLLQGVPGHLSGARTLRPSKRFVALTWGGNRITAKVGRPRYSIRDATGAECAAFVGKSWTFHRADPAVVAFAAFFVSASIEPMLMSPLLELA